MEFKRKDAKALGMKDKSKTLKIYGFKADTKGFMEIPDTLRAMQDFVGGYIEHVSLPNGLDLIVNDEGLINGSEPRLAYYSCDLTSSDITKEDSDSDDSGFEHIYYGDCYICRHKGEEFTSILESDKEWIEQHFIHIHKDMNPILFLKVMLDLRDYMRRHGGRR